MSIPIAAPPGPGGLAPSLLLGYSSDRGDGPFGVGWDLALGEIRCTVRFGVPDYASCPEFEFSGQLLVGPDTRPGMESRYHTQVESFQKIVLQGSGASAYWEVTSPGGLRRIYGETADSKIGSDGHDTPQTAPTARWLLSKIVDLHGNEILISYDRPDVGVAYPDTISYASGKREVRFLYESRPDEILDFPGGIPRNITQRLREIEITSLGTIFSRRLITYSAPGDYSTHRSRIASTQLFGKDCDDPNPVAGCPSMPAQTYEYTETFVSGVDPYWEMAPSGDWEMTPSDDWEEAERFVKTGLQTDSTALGRKLADINGDGLPDLVVSYCLKPDNAPCEDPGPDVYINDGSGWVRDAAWTTAMDSLTYEAPTITVETTPSAPLRACNATTGTVTRGISFATQEADWEAIAVNGNFETYTPWPSWHLVDVNGDGFADLVTSTRGGVVAREYDCAGNPTVSANYDYEVLGGELSQKIFLNNGIGWDPAPAGMAESLPVFQTQTIVKNLYDFESMFGGGVSDCNESGWLGGWSGYAGDYCTTWMDFRPQFVELNGDGLLDVIVLVPSNDGDLLLDYFCSADCTWRGAPNSFAWIQDADGSGWSPAPNFDLPFPHIQYNWLEYEGFSIHGAGGMQPYDAGVYFVDLNRDGLTDIVKDQSHSQSEDAVILGTGTGWCNDLGTWMTSDCDADINHSRYVPPIAFNRYTLNSIEEDVSISEQLVFADLNGDGWVDLLQGKDGHSGSSDVLRAWLHDPSASAVDSAGMPSVWVDQSNDFQPPTPFYAGTQFADLDGNGTTDILHGWRLYFGLEERIEDDAYLSPGTYSDLLASVDNGRGGITDFTYVSAALQRDAAMEDEAESYASASLNDADGDSEAVTQFTTKPVISAHTVSGVGIAPNVTTLYQYARPRFDPLERSGLGFGLVETQKPDGSRSHVHYYQREGLVGRFSSQRTFDQSGSQLDVAGQIWVLPNPASIPGAMEGVDVARVWLQASSNVYGANQQGPLNLTTFYYDDSYGYNFVSQTVNTRATGSLNTIFTPNTEAHDEDKWLVGLVGEKKQHVAGISHSRETYDYTQNGQIEYRHRDIQPRSGGALDVATTSWAYDSYGNVIRQTDTRGGGESDRVVEFCYDGDGRGNSWCPSLPGGTAATHSLRMGVKDAIGDVTELEYDWVTGAVLHIERFNESNDFRDAISVVRDAFRRSKEQWFRGASFTGGDPDILLSTTAYHDAPNGSTPAYVEQFRYAEEAGGTPIRTARYLDGFGNGFRKVEDTPSGYRGTAVYRDPVARVVHLIGPIDCASDASCSNITETTKPATEQEMDAAGRVVRITSPDGERTQDYSWMQRVQPAGWGNGGLFDTVEITDPNGHMTRRLMDGNRLVWVDECQDSGCAAPDSTFYSYEATGEISTIYDAFANGSGDYASSARYLRYHYDTLGRVIQTDEPNTGSSSAQYDHQGNITSTTNVRGATTLTNYDALGRISSIDRPPGVGEWDLDFTYDPISRKRNTATTPDSDYSDNWEYDDFGRVKRQVRTYYDTMAMDFEYDLLGRPTKIYYPSRGSSASYVYEGAYLVAACRGDVTCANTNQAYKLITGVVYDGLGRREDVISNSGTVHREYYSMAAEPGRSANGLKSLAITAGYTAGALDFTYRYDAVGNITEIDDQSTTYDGSAIYTYDARNRLESWTDANNDTKWYTYDSLGNLEGHGVASAGGTNQVFDPASAPHQVVTNRIGEGYEYDPDGNVKKRGSTFFVYNSANQLVCTGSADGICDGPGYRYDADGQLLWDGAAQQQLMGELFKWEPLGRIAYSNIVAFGEVITEVKQRKTYLRATWAPIAWPLPIPKGPFLWAVAGAGVLSLIALLAWLGAGSAFNEAPATATAALVLAGLLVVPPPAWGMGGGSGTVTRVRDVFRDHLGSAAYVTGPTVRQVYEPFGKMINPPVAVKDGFTGKEYHDATDMYYYGARWYDAEAGRFAGVDPLVSNPFDPQNLNAFSYVRNDPVNLIDPTGMASCPGYSGGCYTVYGNRPNHSITPAPITIGGHRSGMPVVAPGAPVATGITDSLREGEGEGDGSSDGSSFRGGLKREVEDLEDQIAELEALVDALQDIYDSLDNELQNLKDTLEIPNDFLGLYREIKGEDGDWAQAFQESYAWTKFVNEVKMNDIARRVNSHNKEIQKMRTRKRFFEKTLGID